MSIEHTQSEKKPKISVCIPVYNVGPYLQECLDSVINQTLKDIEIIIVNDCSTDNSDQIIDEYATKDRRIRAFHFDVNRGTLMARKQAILNSSGEYIVFLDSDDYYSRTNALEEIYQLIKKEDVDILMYSCEILKEGKIYQVTPYFWSSLIPYTKRLNKTIDILKKCFLDIKFAWSMCFKIFKRDCLLKSINKIPDIYFVWAEDVFHFFVVCLEANSFTGIITKPVVTYRRLTGITTRKTDENKKLIIKNYNSLKESFNSIIKTLNKEDIKETSIIIDNIFKHNLKEAIRSCIDENLTKDVFDEIKNSFAPSDIINCLFEIYPEKYTELVNIFSKIRINSQTKFHNSKNIGIYYYSLKQGGIERVISLQIPLFKKLGYNVVLFLEEFISERCIYDVDAEIVIIPKSYQQDRAKLFEKALIDFQIETLIHHAGNSHNILFDTLLLKILGVRLIQQRHDITPWILYYNSHQYSYISKIHSLADKILVLTKMDEQHFRSLGCDNCYFVPNIVQFSTATTNYNPQDDIILWVGRLDHLQKNFSHALEIIKLTIEKKPNAKLVMLGEENSPGSGNFIRDFIKVNKLENNVIWPGSVKDVSSYYKKAKIFLVTSLLEAFPMVIIESKSYGIPLVTYSMPYLEILRDKRGYIEVPQGNVHLAADAIISLLDNPDLCKKLSIEAKETLEPFMTFNHETTWNAILSGSALPHNDYSPDEQRQLYQYQVDAISLFVSRSKIDSDEPRNNQNKFNLLSYLKYKITSKITFGETRARHKKKYQKLKRTLRNTSV